MNENLLNIIKNKKKSPGKYFYYNKYNREIKNKNFEENKNSPFKINEINSGINIKSHEQIYSLNHNKYGFFPSEVDLSFEKNNTLLNDKNPQNYDDNFYKEILFENSKKSEKRTIKIIKCERIYNSSRNNKNKSIIKKTPFTKSNIFTNDNDNFNNNNIDKNRNNLNSDDNLIFKKFQSQEFIGSKLFKNNSNSFIKKNLGIDNSFRKTLPRANNNVLINKIIRRELSENNQKFNFTSNNTHKDIFNTTDKKDIDQEKNLIKRNKLSERKNKEKIIKNIIRNKIFTSSKTTKENTMKNTLENTMKSQYKINKINRVKRDDDNNHISNSNLSNECLSKGFFGSIDNITIYKKENKGSNIFIKKNVNEINKNLFNKKNNNNTKISPKNKKIIFTKKKITLSNNKERRKKPKNIYQKSIIKNNNFNHNKYKTLDDNTNTIKNESKNKINDIQIINNNFRYTEKEILYNKINNNKNGNKNFKTNKSKNKVVSHINLNKNRNKKNFLNKSDKNRDVVSISQKMNKYSSIKYITIEDINSKSFKNLSKSNDFSSYSNIKNTSRENINKINYMSYNIDSNILFSNNMQKDYTKKINKTTNKIRNIENTETIKIKKNIHLDEEDEDKNLKTKNKKNKDYKNRTIINYIYNNKPINDNNNFSIKNNTDFKTSNNILLKSDIKQKGRQLDEKVKNISELFCSNSKDSEYINDNINSTKEIIKELNEQGLSNIQVNSYESQFISNLNPNSNTFSCLNKSEIKLNNKINLDMPVNIDLEKIETEESKEYTKNKSNKLKKENKTKNDAIKVDIKQNNSRFEKLDNFINQLNDEDESDDDEEEEEEKELESEGERKGKGEEEEPEEKIFIQKNKIVYYNSDLPTYEFSIPEKKASKDITSKINDDNKNDVNNNNKFEIDKNKNEKENNINKINNEDVKLYNFDLEIKENENDNKEKNFSNNGFYDDIDINKNNKVNEVEKNDDANYNEKRFNIMDMNIDPPHSDQDFLGNLELIQKNNKENYQEEKELKKNNNIINNNNNNNMKEIDSEYEFNLSKEKFYKPLNKYENAFNFDKINRFKS